MRLEDLNWLDVQSYLEKDDRLIFIIGACEQHAYLSLLSDVKIPQALADAASQRCNVLVAPPVNFGCSPYFLKYPGTLSLARQHLAGYHRRPRQLCIWAGFPAHVVYKRSRWQ